MLPKKVYACLIIFSVAAGVFWLTPAKKMIRGLADTNGTGTQLIENAEAFLCTGLSLDFLWDKGNEHYLYEDAPGAGVAGAPTASAPTAAGSLEEKLTTSSSSLNFVWGLRMNDYVPVGVMAPDKCPSGQLPRAIADAERIAPGIKNYAAWERMREAVSNKDTLAKKLQEAERQVNRYIEYESDQDIYGVEDYWAMPSEILVRAKGDCEDYVIMKYALLVLAGVPKEEMSLLVVSDFPSPIPHALLYIKHPVPGKDKEGKPLYQEYILNNQKSPEHYDNILASQSKPYRVRVAVDGSKCVILGKVIARQQ